MGPVVYATGLFLCPFALDHDCVAYAYRVIELHTLDAFPEARFPKHGRDPIDGAAQTTEEPFLSASRTASC